MISVFEGDESAAIARRVVGEATRGVLRCAPQRDGRGGARPRFLRGAAVVRSRRSRGVVVRPADRCAATRRSRHADPLRGRRGALSGAVADAQRHARADHAAIPDDAGAVVGLPDAVRARRARRLLRHRRPAPGARRRLRRRRPPLRLVRPRLPPSARGRMAARGHRAGPRPGRRRCASSPRRTAGALPAGVHRRGPPGVCATSIASICWPATHCAGRGWWPTVRPSRSGCCFATPSTRCATIPGTRTGSGRWTGPTCGRRRPRNTLPRYSACRSARIAGISPRGSNASSPTSGSASSTAARRPGRERSEQKPVW